jgi:glycosyltransferase involved in cell wall biosynthesis
VTFRLAWLSPYSDASEISMFTRALLPHLVEPLNGEAFNVTLFVNEAGSRYPSPVPTMRLRPLEDMQELLQGFDCVVFNLGNNQTNHLEILDLAQRFPGVCILHDVVMHHYIAWECFTRHSSPAAYARLVQEVYGPAGFEIVARSGVSSWSTHTMFAPWDSEHVATLPFHEMFTPLASAAVVHSRFAGDAIKTSYRGPSLQLSLPCDLRPIPEDREVARWADQTADTKCVVFSSFGHIGPTKCLDLAISAFEGSALLRSCAEYRIVGRASDPEHARDLERMVRERGLQNNIHFEFDVADERLEKIKQASDVFINLRYPNTEGGSASLTSQLACGKPTIAFAAGCYADVPDNAIVKIARSEAGALQAAMESLARSPKRRIAIGRAGRKFALSTDSRTYARKLKEFLLENRALLARRSRFIAPERDAMPWRADDLTTSDDVWLAGLGLCRGRWASIQLDADCRGPRPFLAWPVEQLAVFVCDVLLGLPPTKRTLRHFTQMMTQRGRMQTYLAISRLRALLDVLRYRNEDEKPVVRDEPVLDPDLWAMIGDLDIVERCRLGFVALTGRTPTPREIDEFTRAHPELDLAALVQWISARIGLSFSAAQREKFVELQTFLRELPENEEAEDLNLTTPIVSLPLNIHFTRSEPNALILMQGGWHTVEDHGCWSKATAAHLRFILQPTDGERLRITLLLAVSGFERFADRRIKIYANGLEVASRDFIKNPANVENFVYEKIGFTWTRSTHTPMTVLLLTIETDRVFNPAKEGVGPDVRDLGFLLCDLSISEMESPDCPAHVDSPMALPMIALAADSTHGVLAQATPA